MREGRRAAGKNPPPRARLLLGWQGDLELFKTRLTVGSPSNGPRASWAIFH